MSAAAAALDTKLQRTITFYQSTIGKKAIMAGTGVILFGFIIGHMIGNLQIYLGPEKLNHYAQTLRALPALLWAVRIALLACVVVHITAALQLWLLQRQARPKAYVKRANVGSSYASRTMMVSGPILAAFIVYHLLHFTTGQAHPDFEEMQVYHNVITGFQQPAASIAYIIAMFFLGLHLIHGVWSMFQTVGVSHPRYTPIIQAFATVSTAIIVVGNISIPLSVLIGVLK